ncbi:MAG TPA: 4-hydroxy-3-methylbut-2-enyl diphosphate reductase [Beijerinckiaceae bacterium]|jgi:4-hydroxy-3-methylbut-2-enyl diphosphate reductase
MTKRPLTVLLAAPRGFCAGVERAIAAVDETLALSQRPVYVRHEIVHNGRVVEALRAKGAVFVEEVSEIPAGAVAVFSAHGVPKRVEQEAGARNLRVVDATCPLVRRVHQEGRRHAEAGREIVLIGHAGHVEVEGTLGQIPGTVHVVGDAAQVEALRVRDPENLAYVTQTTLSVDDTRVILSALRRRFPRILGPDTRTICYATQNRQAAVRAVAARAERVVVCGARNSSNTNRLRELAETLGRPALLAERPEDVTSAFLAGIATLGLTAGASAPEDLVQEVIARLRRWRALAVEEVRVTQETVRFAPVDLSALSERRCAT